LSLYLYKRN